MKSAPFPCHVYLVHVWVCAVCTVYVQCVYGVCTVRICTVCVRCVYSVFVCVHCVCLFPVGCPPTGQSVCCGHHEEGQ